MDLLSMLMGSMTSGDSVNAMSQKTGASSKQIKMLIALALPILIKYLTKNASSQSGAQSLLGALTQHTNKKSMADQIADADEEDGKKILNHILGQNSGSVASDLAGQTGLSGDQVMQILGNMAPSMMSGLSAATNAGAQQQADSGFDFTDLLGMFGGKPAQSQSSGIPGLGLLGSLLGGGSAQVPDEKDDNLNGTALLGTLMSLMK